MNTDRAIDIDPGWITGLLQCSDSFYPTGGYAHSFGLEGLVQTGIVSDRASLQGFLRESILPQLRQTELPLVAETWRALAAPADWESVRELSVLAQALKSSREARAAVHDIGRQRAELLVLLRPGGLATEYLERASAGGWPFAAPVSAALEGRIHGVPLAPLLAAVAYASLAAVVAAAMKLLRLGQRAAHTLLTAALRDVPAVVRFAESVPRARIGWFNPWLDIAAARHETSDFRLFIS